jgi:hypothetical protein
MLIRPANDGENGLPDDQQVEGPPRVFDVFDVVADPFLEIGAGGARAFDLPEAGDAGATNIALSQSNYGAMSRLKSPAPIAES